MILPDNASIVAITPISRDHCELIPVGLLIFTFKVRLLTYFLYCLSALFWRVDEYTCDWELMDIIMRAQDTIVHATERNQPEEDLRLVDQAIMHL